MLSSIFNKIKPKEKLNILTCPTHERYETNLCETGHNFYSITGPGIKYWRNDYAKKPDNYTIIDGKNKPLPKHIDFDLVLSQNKFGQYQVLAPIARDLRIPLISLEHTLPHAGWEPAKKIQAMRMVGNVNVFISEYSRDAWGFKNAPNTKVIHHGVDTDLFSPDYGDYDRKDVILSVVNDWANRDYFCGFDLWRNTTQELPVFPVGDTKGLSTQAKDVYELVNFYKTSKIFYNTSQVSPIPTSLLEAMSCGCACVSSATCMIPDIIDNTNGYISNNPQRLRKKLEYLLHPDNEEEAKELGENARKTILEKFPLDVFVKSWNDLFYEVIK